MGFKINEHVKWVGNIDWDLRKFHGEEYSAHRGSSYNSYLIEDEKTALIDTVWAPFSEAFVQNLKKEIDLRKIDYIILNHGEIDHSGGLVDLMKEIPDTPIYCTANAVKSLKGQFHQDWNFVQVKTGDTLSLGTRTLTFVEARMLHWPDSMMTYMDQDNILFSNDAFGQHYASSEMYNDTVDQGELFQEAIKYYANILTPFSKLVENKINELLAMGIPVDMICPSHGVIWKENPLQIVEKYMEWARDYRENQITILYETMWENTRKMAEAIGERMLAADPGVKLKLINLGKTDKNDVLTQVFKSKGVVMGSSTINNGILSNTAGLLEMIKGLKFKGKAGAAFGSYGWSGESPKIIEKALEDAGFDVMQEGYRVLWTPDQAALEEGIAFGGEFVKHLQR
ncbi:anaerobic nitric oxide reductase flavorubredoxin [Isachenkonia alkalipeptolytica]|uniref:Anaerobic nitric oxide reductase flavorubredoxin n=1 Tax=Isachenkonia alkalipeptolytica TaxID=2565777 RepID=A0AA44BE86_9CLOT|nr:anaerobic nitric oxide reductase flavorubredoxin [Isachenkonia alkalipeptolytica]NBG88663.1 anaerobic nitric oxide reductase flavorubredoxin [Isachenkonia alkalipeptolytica]